MKGPARVILEGSGIWTTPDQNPVQNGDPGIGKRHQENAISIGRGLLGVGRNIVVIEPDERSREKIELS